MLKLTATTIDGSRRNKNMSTINNSNRHITISRATTFNIATTADEATITAVAQQQETQQ